MRRWVMWSLMTVAVGVLVMAVPVVADEAAQSPMAEGCRADLAKRIAVDVAEITVAKSQPVVWPDAALGLPKPGMMYAQMLTSGWALVLKSPKGDYLYTTSRGVFRYGGPMQMWKYSALFLRVIEDEPNLNGDLVQVSLGGTNPAMLIHLVDSFRAQPNGSVTTSRRTSRSSYELLYLAPGEAGSERQIAAGFCFGDSAVSPDGKEWLAFRRTGVGGVWEVAGNALDAEPTSIRSLALPEGTQPSRLYWEPEGRIVAVLKQGETSAACQLVREGDVWSWKKLDRFVAPELEALSLNKSEGLVVHVQSEDGKSVTRVATEWFTGDVTREVLLEGFAMKTFAFTPCQRFVLLSGVEGETPKAYTVDIATGERLVCATEFVGDAQLLLVAPRGARGIPVLKEG